MAAGVGTVRSFSWGRIVGFLRLFRDLGACVLTSKPFVHKGLDTLSLHFDLLATQSQMRTDAPNELQLPYTKTMMGFLLFNPRPGRIAMIGLGGGSMAKYCYQQLPRSTIVVAEISAEVIGLRKQFQIPPDDERFSVLCVDGADFVRDPAAEFDVLLVDGFDRRGQAPQLCSSSFYANCRQRLAPGGLLVVNMARPDSLRVQRINRIRDQFPVVIAVDSDDLCSQIIFAFPAGTACTPVEQLLHRLGPLEHSHPVDLRRTLFKIRSEQRRQLLD